MRILTFPSLTLLLVIGLVFFSGCTTQTTDATDDKMHDESIPELWDESFVGLWDRASEEERWAFLSERERDFRTSKAIRELDNIPGIDNPAILINGLPVARREVEVRNIHINFPFGTEQLSEIVRPIIRDEVALQEAIRLGLEVSQDSLERRISAFKQNLESIKEILEKRIEGLGVTEEEYLAEQEKRIYNDILIFELSVYVRNTKADAISAEADRRDVLFVVVAQEFFERYVDDLVDQATIDILDPEILAYCPLPGQRLTPPPQY